MYIEPISEKYRSSLTELLRTKRFYHIFEEDIKWSVEFRKKILAISTIIYDMVKS